LGHVFRELARQKESRMEEGHLMPDHVHMLISIPPKYAMLTALVLAAVMVLTQGNGVARAASAPGIDADVAAALMKLYAEQPVAKMLAQKAAAILVFPNMVKAGILVGVQYGEGALLKKGRTVGYYNSVAGSYRLQVGAHSFGYVLFLMTNSAVDYSRWKR
jgi:lipid-binding SYLF domain-containing protein